MNYFFPRYVWFGHKEYRWFALYIHGGRKDVLIQVNPIKTEFSILRMSLLVKISSQ